MKEEIVEKYWSRFPDTYDKNQEYVVGRELPDEIPKELNDLPDLGKMCEIGCGTGYFTEMMAPKSKRIVATDLSDRLLEISKQRFNNNPGITF